MNKHCHHVAHFLGRTQAMNWHTAGDCEAGICRFLGLFVAIGLPNSGGKYKVRVHSRHGRQRGTHRDFGVGIIPVEPIMAGDT